MFNTDARSLRLRFSGDLEQRFREDYYEKSLNSLRISLLLGAVIYGLFGVLDAWIFPATKSAAWAIRYGIACPVILACLGLTYTRGFKDLMQPVIFSAVILCGACIVAMMVVVKSPINYFHNAGLLLVLMYVFTFSKLRFLYTCIASWAIVLVYELAAVAVMRVPMTTILNDNYLFISANLIGMFSHYHRERYMRRDFLHNLTIREMEEKRHILEREKILRDLHDGLGGITTNICLLAEIAQNAAQEEEIKRMLGTIAGLSREGLAEIKGFMQSLDGQEISWQSLAPELRMNGRNLVEPHGIAFIMTARTDEARGRPGSLMWLNVQRVYKEALINVVKHSRGRSVAVELHVDARRLLLAVRDDGGGIPDRASGGRGLPNMRKRAEEIGGSVTIRSEQGTLVRLEVPLQEQPACADMVHAVAANA